MQNFLKSGKFFKLICAAGNEDLEQIEKLVYIYTKAGCRFFDIAADKNVVLSAKNAIKRADINEKAFICTSIGTKNDPHTQKAFINDFCTKCAKCIKICPQKAIINFQILQNKCIGCGKCYNICNEKAILMMAVRQNFEAFLPELINLDINCIEFHISDFYDEVFETWNWLNQNFKGILSISIGTFKLNEEEVIAILDKLLQSSNAYSTIIQADGTPISADNNKMEITQKAIETGLLIQKQNYKTYLNLAGGTNLQTAKLSYKNNLHFDGIALGTFARNAMEKYLFDENFWKDENLRQEAVSRAKNILKSALG